MFAIERQGGDEVAILVEDGGALLKPVLAWLEDSGE